MLKGALVDVPILIQPDFKKQFCLDVDYDQKVLEPSCHRKKASLRRWWPMPERV